MAELKSFQRWQQNLKQVRLVHWRDLPAIELYIDQVAAFVNETLDALNIEPLTKSMINNYVKKGVIVAPVKKKYGTNQVADLVVIGLMKSCFSLQDIKAGIAQVTMNAYPQRVYDRFVDLFNARLAGDSASPATQIDHASDYLLRLTVETLVARLTAAKLLATMQEHEQPKQVQ